MLESFDNLPDLVFNYLNDADPATTNQQITFVVHWMNRCAVLSLLLRALTNACLGVNATRFASATR